MPQADIGPALLGTPAPYGRACTNCARAKCRCIYRSEGASCDRCHRLHKECTPSVSARKRTNKRQASSRTAQLEEKLEDLVAMLRNQNSVNQPALSNIGVQNAGIAIPTPNNTSPSERSANGASDTSAGPSPIAATDHRGTGPRSPCDLTSGAFEADPFCPGGRQSGPNTVGSMVPTPTTPAGRLEAEDGLYAFRTHYLEVFPCVYIPSAMTARQLREERPFLWYCIMMVSCQSAQRQLAMSDAIQKIVAQQLVVEQEKSMDMLLGLIVFLGWSHYNRKDKPYVSVFSQLAVSLVFDLALHKPPGDSSMACFKPYNFTGKVIANKERTMEDRRAILACFHVISLVSYTMKKLEGLSWTPYMDECLNELSRNPECPRDEILVSHVRIQLIVEQLHRAPWQLAEPSPGPVGPPFSYLNALHSQREKIKNELPAGLERRVFIELQLHYTKLVTLETGLTRNQSSFSSNPDFRRYEICSKSLDAVKSWFDVFFTIPTTDYPSIAFMFWCQLMHCVISLYKLTTLDEPAWDRSFVRDEIDLVSVCAKLEAQFDAIAAKRRSVSGVQPGSDAADEDMFLKSTRIIHTMKIRWEAELAAMERPSETRSAGGEATANGFVDNVTTGPLAVPMMIPDELWAGDNMWLTDIFNVSWD